eukprot:TRINITY_DN179_c1_g1_i1.p1 TRINITY_DN179_c1_g1~~TRINITY_DN179_c1_g1_i1.p1  ORF type:complete len:1047 (+),score=360.22 TRINITY_DN179_c1_g1_i1:119-3259(+)
MSRVTRSQRRKTGVSIPVEPEPEVNELLTSTRSKRKGTQRRDVYNTPGSPTRPLKSHVHETRQHEAMDKLTQGVDRVLAVVKMKEHDLPEESSASVVTVASSSSSTSSSEVSSFLTSSSSSTTTIEQIESEIKASFSSSSSHEEEHHEEEHHDDEGLDTADSFSQEEEDEMKRNEEKERERERIERERTERESDHKEEKFAPPPPPPPQITISPPITQQLLLPSTSLSSQQQSTTSTSDMMAGVPSSSSSSLSAPSSSSSSMQSSPQKTPSQQAAEEDANVYKICPCNFLDAQGNPVPHTIAQCRNLRELATPSPQSMEDLELEEKVEDELMDIGVKPRKRCLWLRRKATRCGFRIRALCAKLKRGFLLLWSLLTYLSCFACRRTSAYCAKRREFQRITREAAEKERAARSIIEEKERKDALQVQKGQAEKDAQSQAAAAAIAATKLAAETAERESQTERKLKDDEEKRKFAEEEAARMKAQALEEERKRAELDAQERLRQEKEKEAQAAAAAAAAQPVEAKPSRLLPILYRVLKITAVLLLVAAVVVSLFYFGLPLLHAIRTWLHTKSTPTTPIVESPIQAPTEFKCGAVGSQQALCDWVKQVDISIKSILSTQERHSSRLAALEVLPGQVETVSGSVQELKKHTHDNHAEWTQYKSELLEQVMKQMTNTLNSKLEEHQRSQHQHADKTVPAPTISMSDKEIAAIVEKYMKEHPVPSTTATTATPVVVDTETKKDVSKLLEDVASLKKQDQEIFKNVESLTEKTKSMMESSASATTTAAEQLQTWKNDVQTQLKSHLATELKAALSSSPVATSTTGGVAKEEMKEWIASEIEAEEKKLRDEMIMLTLGDKTGKVDWAARWMGARVVDASPTFSEAASGWAWLNYIRDGPSKNPDEMLTSDMTPGSCWPMKMNKEKPGYAVIRFRQPIVPTHITLEHTHVSISPNATTAPKNFHITLISIRDRTIVESEVVIRDSFKVDNHTLPVQTFSIPTDRVAGKGFDGIKLYIDSNYGHPDYTCIYRFRVHGSVALIPKKKVAAAVAPKANN